MTPIVYVLTQLGFQGYGGLLLMARRTDDKTGPGILYESEFVSQLRRRFWTSVTRDHSSLLEGSCLLCGSSTS